MMVENHRRKSQRRICGGYEMLTYFRRAHIRVPTLMLACRSAILNDVGLSTRKRKENTKTLLVLG